MHERVEPLPPRHVRARSPPDGHLTDPPLELRALGAVQLSQRRRAQGELGLGAEDVEGPLPAPACRARRPGEISLPLNIISGTVSSRTDASNGSSTSDVALRATPMVALGSTPETAAFDIWSRRSVSCTMVEWRVPVSTRSK